MDDTWPREEREKRGVKQGKGGLRGGSLSLREAVSNRDAIIVETHLRQQRENLKSSKKSMLRRERGARGRVLQGSSLNAPSLEGPIQRFEEGDPAWNSSTQALGRVRLACLGAVVSPW